MCDELRRLDEIGHRPGHFMNAIATCNVFVLIAQQVSRVAFRIVLTGPMQVWEHERGSHTEFVRIGLLRVTRMSAAQRPVIGTITLDCEGLSVA